MKQSHEESEAITVEALQEALKVAEEQATQNLGGWQRAQADYANLKRETAENQHLMTTIATTALLEDLLPIYNHFKLALKHIPEATRSEGWATGLGHIEKQFRDLLTKYQVNEIKTVGESFDPSRHEALAHEAHEGTDTDIIFEEVMPGYTIGERVLMPAKVKVAA